MAQKHPDRFAHELLHGARTIGIETSRQNGIKSDPVEFARFAAPLMRVSPSQLGQDLWALWETNLRRRGYFVEFGVADGRSQSNTYLLEKCFQWSGIVAEPNPAFHRSVKSHRTCFVSEKCVYWSSGETAKFLAVDSAMLSRLEDIEVDDWAEEKNDGPRKNHRRIEVPTISLGDLLLEANAPRKIDYMSVDTEGSEYAILEAFDFSKWHIKLITVEHNYTSSREKIHDLLVRNGYQRRNWPAVTRFDDWYVKEEE